MDKIKVLVIDDEKNICRFLSDCLKNTSCEVDTATSAEKGIELFQKVRHDIVFTDLRMKGISGMGVIEQIKKTDENAVIVMMTAYASIETAVEAMKKGACDYIRKPFDKNTISFLIDSFMKQTSTDKKPANVDIRIPDLIGESEIMKKIYIRVQQAAQTDFTVLIIGESGTGKELVAKTLHNLSHRASKAFVVVDCGALQETVLESELFGHKKGSFTGALEDKKGLFSYAEGGTIFLDEISNMSPQLQMKLLRVIQEREIRPIGSNVSVSVDVRIIAATNKDLKNEIDKENFRLDLYYRLSEVPIKLPSLREKPEDIPILTEYFFNKYSPNKDGKKTLSKKSMKIFEGYSWPGNARELEATIKRIYTLTNAKEIKPEDLPEEIISQSNSVPLADYKEKRKTALDSFEKEFIEKALKKHKGNVSKAAEEIGITRRALHEKIHNYKIDTDSFRR
jgi:two-component system NtrC family response regulator